MLQMARVAREAPMTNDSASEADLRRQIVDLAPWHHRIHLRGELFTGGGRTVDDTGAPVPLIDPLEVFQKHTRNVLPHGMQGRSFLDCGCNCGGFSFAAKDCGAGSIYGFDIRQHWIDQANFIARNRSRDSSGVSFERADLQHLHSLREEFDVSWFGGLLYHLPDPVAGLRLAADKTKELLFLHTAVVGSEPDEAERPSLVMKMEGTERLLSGVWGLSWLPSGPRVLRGILKWMGFPETRILMWRKKKPQNRNPGAIPLGRILIVAAREEGRLSGSEN